MYWQTMMTMQRDVVGTGKTSGALGNGGTAAFDNCSPSSERTFRAEAPEASNIMDTERIILKKICFEAALYWK
jgi:hypothetical protein